MSTCRMALGTSSPLGVRRVPTASAEPQSNDARRRRPAARSATSTKRRRRVEISSCVRLKAASFSASGRAAGDAGGGSRAQCSVFSDPGNTGRRRTRHPIRSCRAQAAEVRHHYGDSSSGAVARPSTERRSKAFPRGPPPHDRPCLLYPTGSLSAGARQSRHGPGGHRPRPAGP